MQALGKFLVGFGVGVAIAEGGLLLLGDSWPALIASAVMCLWAGRLFRLYFDGQGKQKDGS